MKAICPICKEHFTVRGRREEGRLKPSKGGRTDPRPEIVKYIEEHGCKKCYLDGKRVPGHKKLFGDRR